MILLKMILVLQELFANEWGIAKSLFCLGGEAVNACGIVWQVALGAAGGNACGSQRMFAAASNANQGFPYEARVKRPVMEPLSNEREALDFVDSTSSELISDAW